MKKLYIIASIAIFGASCMMAASSSPCNKQPDIELQIHNIVCESYQKNGYQSWKVENDRADPDGGCNSQGKDENNHCQTKSDSSSYKRKVTCYKKENCSGDAQNMATSGLTVHVITSISCEEKEKETKPKD